ncbi:hypothetical protein AX17_000127 [Amanita inopinata Kibby_2008]|nr:hypothetical protein AX17_000127 [Amanita inopinata Kibby_2008]
MAIKIPYALLTAFSNDTSGGNPAAVVFTDITQPDEVYLGIAKNLHQPMTMFVTPKARVSPDEPEIASFGIRYFTSYEREIPLCGHGTLAVAQAILTDGSMVSPKVNVLEFQTPNHGVVRARRIEGGFIEIQLPSTVPEEVSPEERVRLTSCIHKAFGREIPIRYIGKGGPNFEIYLMVEIEQKSPNELKDSIVDTNALLETGYAVNMVTAASATEKELFVSRMFSPGYVPSGEDMVCGSAHCLVGPYWYKQYGIPSGSEVKATQVSPRGGNLRLVWKENEGIMTLRGQVATLARGELYM